MLPEETLDEPLYDDLDRIRPPWIQSLEYLGMGLNGALLMGSTYAFLTLLWIDRGDWQVHAVALFIYALFFVLGHGYPLLYLWRWRQASLKYEAMGTPDLFRGAWGKHIHRALRVSICLYGIVGTMGSIRSFTNGNWIKGATLGTIALLAILHYLGIKDLEERRQTLLEKIYTPWTVP